jgi:hypothetical protein
MDVQIISELAHYSNKSRMALCEDGAVGELLKLLCPTGAAGILYLH